jgi:hypothetical protein
MRMKAALARSSYASQLSRLADLDDIERFHNGVTEALGGGIREGDGDMVQHRSFYLA